MSSPAPMFQGATFVDGEGIAPADRYLAPDRKVCAAWETPLLSAPERGAEQADQLLHGEAFAVLAERDGFAFGQAERDGYVGWVEIAALDSAGPPPDRWVTALRTYVFSKPSLKSHPLGQLSLNALLAAGEEQAGFIAAATGWVWADHVAPIGSGFAGDLAAIAELYLGAPYRWGGRDSLGLDCSGLVQQALYACGRGCPRDSGDQRALGLEIGGEDLDRNDLVFWRGHVGVMLDRERLLHANGWHMAVAIEPLETAITRIARTEVGPPVAYRRL